MLHPEVAARSCADCRTWLYRDEPGKFGEVVTRGGSRVRRPARSGPPCSWCPKTESVPEADRCPETAVELADENWQAWQHYRECQAVGSFPDDAIVRRNAAILAGAEKAADQLVQLNLALLSGGRPRGV